MDPRKTGRRGRERRERQGGRVWRERGEAGRGGGWREKGKWTRKGRNSRKGRNGKRLYVEWGSTNTTDTSVFMMKISHILKYEGK